MYKLLVILLLFFFTNYGVCAQLDKPNLVASGINADSLFSLLHAEITSANKVDVLVQLSEYYLNHQPDSSFHYAKDAELLALKTNDLNGIGKSKRMKGENFLLQGIYNQAIQHFIEAIQYFEKENNDLQLAKTLISLGISYQYSKQLNTALEYYQKALAIYLGLQHKKGLANTYGYIGHILEKTQRYPEALLYQRKALERYKELNDALGTAMIYENLGSIYEDLEHFDSAYFYFSASAELNEKNNNRSALIGNLNNIGDTYRKRGEYEKALLYAKKALNLAKALKQKYQIRSGYRDLSKIYGSLKDYEQAYYYMDSTYEYTGALFNTQIAEQIAQLQTFYEAQQKEQEIALLESQKKADDLLIYTFVIGIVLLSVTAYVIISRQKLKISRNKALMEKKQKIYETQQELTKAELKNIQLREKALQTALENRKLKELQLNNQLEIKDKEMTTRALHIIQKNKILKDLKKQIEEIRNNSSGGVKKKELTKLSKQIDYSFSFDKDWKDFQNSFEHVHSAFFENLKSQYPDLTPSEIRLCALLKLNLNSKDISTILGISHDSLRIARYRLRKRFNLEKGSNLVNHIMHL